MSDFVDLRCSDQIFFFTIIHVTTKEKWIGETWNRESGNRINKYEIFNLIISERMMLLPVFLYKTNNLIQSHSSSRPLSPWLLLKIILKPRQSFVKDNSYEIVCLPISLLSLKSNSNAIPVDFPHQCFPFHSLLGNKFCESKTNSRIRA